MNLREIYNLILAGKTVKLSFASESEKETFRVKLYKFKRLQEHAMLQIGMLEPEDQQALSFIVENNVATISLKNKRRLRDYNVTILDDADDAATDVPRNLGAGEEEQEE